MILSADVVICANPVLSDWSKRFIVANCDGALWRPKSKTWPSDWDMFGNLVCKQLWQIVETICLGTFENWFLLRNCMAWWHFASPPVFVHPVPGPEFSYFRPRSFGWPVFGLAEPRRCWRTHPKTGVLDLQLSCATYSWPKRMLPWPSPFWSPGHWMEFSEIFLECFCSCVGCLALLQWHNCVFPALAWRGLMETSVRNSLGCWKKKGSCDTGFDTWFQRYIYIYLWGGRAYVFDGLCPTKLNKVNPFFLHTTS